MLYLTFFLQAEDGIRDLVRSRGLGDVYKRQQQRVCERRAARARSVFQPEPRDEREIAGHQRQHARTEKTQQSRCERHHDRQGFRRHVRPRRKSPVSYTHLTLPTSDLV